MKTKTKEEIVAILQEKKDGATLKELSAKHNVGVSTISTWQAKQAKNSKKPKRKTSNKVKRAVKSKPTDTWQKVFDSYIFHRDEAEKLKRQLEKIVKELK